MRERIDAVVVMMGTLQLADAKYSGLTGVHTILDEALQTRYRAAMGRALDRLGAAEIPVLWADLPTPQWDVDKMGEVQGIPIDGAGEATTNDPARAEELNALDAEVLDSYPLAGRWSYAAILAGPDDVIDEGTRYDGVHISLDLARQLVQTSVLDVLETTYRSLAAAAPLADPPDGLTTWDLPRTAAGAG